MMRYLVHFFIALFLFVVETSLFASFHGLIRFTPFVFVVSVYLLQHHDVHAAASWMILYGILLDLSGISPVPFITLSYILTAWVAYTSAERLFSNRSFYGVIACACLSYLTFFLSSTFLLFSSALMQKKVFYFSSYFFDSNLRFVMLLLSLVLLFSFAKQIRHFLVKVSLISPTRQTY